MEIHPHTDPLEGIWVSPLAIPHTLSGSRTFACGLELMYGCHGVQECSRRMFNSPLEDVLQPWRAVCCHNVLNITTHQNLLRPSGAFHSLRFIAKATHIDLGK